MSRWAVCLAAIFFALPTTARRFRPKSSPNPCPILPPPIPLPKSPTSYPLIKSALEKIDELFQHTMNVSSIPGLVANVVYDQKMIWGKGYGLQNASNPSMGEPTMDSFVRIASITKVFTSLLMFHARDHGVISSLDDPLVKYMPAFKIKNPYSTNKKISLRELASHTAGLPRENPCFSCNESSVLSVLAERFLIIPEYHRPHYSNLGFALLGRALGHALHERYEDALEERILRPMGMKLSTFNATSLGSKLAIGVDENGHPVFPNADWDNWNAPDGSLLSSPREMAELMKLAFRENATANGKQQVLDAATISEFERPVVQLRDGQAAFGTPLEFHFVSGTWLKSKAGELNGFRSQLALAPELKLGVFVSAFRSTIDEWDPTGSAFTEQMMDFLIPAFTSTLAGLEPSPVLPKDPQYFLGNYGPGGNIHISLNNGVISVDAFGQKFTSEDFKTGGVPTSFRILRVKLVDIPRCRFLDDGPNLELAYFFGNASGHATGLIFMGNEYKRV